MAAESTRPEHDVTNNQDQPKKQLTALHKYTKTVYNHITAEKPDMIGLYPTTAENVSGTHFRHIGHTTGTYFTVKKGAHEEIHEFAKNGLKYRLQKQLFSKFISQTTRR